MYSHCVNLYLEELLCFRVWYGGNAAVALVAIFMNEMLQILHTKYWILSVVSVLYN